MWGIASVLKSSCGNAVASTSRALGPAILMAAHWSDTEATVTRNSGHTTCSRNSRWPITFAAWAVVVVMKNSVSPRRLVVPSSITMPSSRSMKP